MTPRVEEQVTCCYAVADKWWAADPDGNEWEFWVRSDEADRRHHRAAQQGEHEDHPCREGTPVAPGELAQPVGGAGRAG